MKTVLDLRVICFVSALGLAMSLTSTAQTFQTVASFGTNLLLPTGVTEGVNGNLYALADGGVNRWGVVAEVASPNVVPIYSFCALSNCTDGSFPIGSLVLGADANLYGSTFGGGSSSSCPGCGLGTVFRVNPGGAFTKVHDFCMQTDCTDGSAPESGLSAGIDGNLYGVTFNGGTSAAGGNVGNGTVFQLTTSGQFKTLYNFCSLANCSDGSNPFEPPIQGMDGNLYGTTGYGGSHNLGSVYALNQSGQLRTIASFRRSADSGVQPLWLIQATDGTLYGTTSGGGAAGDGTIFKITPSGSMSTLYSFCSLANCADGQGPTSLLQGPDGNLYGTTGTGGGCGPVCGGTIFQLTPQGTLTTLYNFCSQSSCTDGDTPLSMTLSTDGKLYGVTYYGGAVGHGSVFSLSMGFSPFVQPNPAAGKSGRAIGILGNNLTGTTAVTFNGTPAVFTVISDTLIRATVPSGATTGPIQVTTPSGSLSSIVNFQVR